MPEIASVHVNAIELDGTPRSYTFDEAEFNDGSIDWNDMVNGLIAEGHTTIRIEIEVEK